MDESEMRARELEFFWLFREQLAFHDWRVDLGGRVLSIGLEGSPPDTRVVVETDRLGRCCFPLWPSEDEDFSLANSDPGLVITSVISSLYDGTADRFNPCEGPAQPPFGATGDIASMAAPEPAPPVARVPTGPHEQVRRQLDALWRELVAQGTREADPDGFIRQLEQAYGALPPNELPFANEEITAWAISDDARRRSDGRHLIGRFRIMSAIGALFMYREGLAASEDRAAFDEWVAIHRLLGDMAQGLAGEGSGEIPG